MGTPSGSHLPFLRPPPLPHTDCPDVAPLVHRSPFVFFPFQLQIGSGDQDKDQSGLCHLLSCPFPARVRWRQSSPLGRLLGRKAGAGQPL